MSSTNNILFIANGRSKRLKKLRAQIERVVSSINWELKVTGAAGDAEVFAADHEGFSHVVAIGGDGTVHEVVNGILNSKNKENLPAVGVVSAGSANDFCKSFNSLDSIKEVVDAIANNVTFRCDVGQILFLKSDKTRYFINIADAGIGAMVVEEVNKQSNKINTSVAFFRAIIKSFRRYNNVSIRCETEDWEWKGKMKMLAVSNGQYFGSGLRISPHGKLNSGMLAITIGADISTYDYVKNLPALKKGAFIDHPQLHYKEAKKIKINSEERCGLEADGEVMEDLPVEISILPAKLKMIGTL